MNETIKMQISAFVDGELPDNEAELLLRRMSQDATLRSQVGEYLEIGRIMRGEASVRGMQGLRERVGAEIDDRPLQSAGEPEAADKRRNWKPLTGMAVAASVAVAAIFALQQVQTVPQGDAVLAEQVVDAAEQGSYTVPPNEELVRQYLMSHGAATSSLGDNGIGARWVSLDFSTVENQSPDDAENAAEEDEMTENVQQ